MIEISKELVFIPQRGLYERLEDGEHCIASSEGYVTPLFVVALQGKLAERFEPLLQAKEWKQLPVNTPFVSYHQLCHYVTLKGNRSVCKTMPKGEVEALDMLVRVYLNWLIEREDAIVREKPQVWFEPAFYPSGVYSEDGDFDPYERYDKIPFGGFAKAAFYFFVSNTAKDYLRKALEGDDLLASAKEAIEKSKEVLDDLYNVKINTGLFRSLLEAYLNYCYEQEELRLAHDVTLTEDDLWQEIYDKEKHAYEKLKGDLEKMRLFDLRPLLEVQGDLMTRMRKDHPLLLADGKPRIGNRNVPSNGDYVGLAEWIRDEKRDNRDWKKDAGGKWTSLCKDKVFLRRIGWERCNADSLRHAIHEIEKKNQ